MAPLLSPHRCSPQSRTGAGERHGGNVDLHLTQRVDPHLHVRVLRVHDLGGGSPCARGEVQAGADDTSGEKKSLRCVWLCVVVCGTCVCVCVCVCARRDVLQVSSVPREEVCIRVCCTHCHLIRNTFDTQILHTHPADRSVRVRLRPYLGVHEG